MQGYASSAQTPYALDNMRWIGDYIMKLHYSDVEFCAQARPYFFFFSCRAAGQWPRSADAAGAMAQLHVHPGLSAASCSAVMRMRVSLEPRPAFWEAGIMGVLCRTQVGDVNTDHAAWGRAEDMGNMWRPSYSVNPNKPGARALGRSKPHIPYQ